MRLHSVALIVAFAAAMCAAPSARACPFCQAPSQTLSEEIASMDAVVICRMVKAPPPAAEGESVDFDTEVPKATFRIEQVIKGKPHINGMKEIETIYFGDAKMDRPYLIMGVDPPKLAWSTPLVLTEKGKEYIARLGDLPAEGPKRLAFFLGYLENEDDLLARDAYDEFAKAPYSEIEALEMELAADHDQIVKWIHSADIPASRRRLYLTLLSTCGRTEDQAMLEALMKSDDRRQKAGLDAMIACYLTLKGPDGMPLVEDLFLKNKKAEYADTYACIMALRFHGTEVDVVPKMRIVEAVRHMLDRPQLADLVIPDLARWEDWSVMDKLVTLFKEADEKSSWVRVPVINYLRACPLPEAKEHITELEKIDPEAVKRANTFFPFGPSSAGSGDVKSSWSRPQPVTPVAREAETPALAPVGEEMASAPSRRTVAAAALSIPAVSDSAPPSFNVFVLLTVGAALGGVFLTSQWMILRGGAR